MAATRMSACRVMAGMSAVREWQTVTVALASDDDDVLSGGVVTVAYEHFADACRSGGGKPLATLGQETDVEGVERVHVLEGTDRLDYGVLIKVVGQG